MLINASISLFHRDLTGVKPRSRHRPAMMTNALVGNTHFGRFTKKRVKLMGFYCSEIPKSVRYCSKFEHCFVLCLHYGDNVIAICRI